MMKLKAEQIDEVVRWMNTWEQLRDTAIPIRFKEYYTEQLHKPDVSGSLPQEVIMWLGQWRDALPIEAIHALQKICGYDR